MAEDKKKDDKKKPPAPKSLWNELIFFLAGLLLLAIIFGRIAWYFNSIGWGNFASAWNYFLHSYFYPFWAYWKVFAAILSAGAVVWFVYSYRKLQKVVKDEEKAFGPMPEESFIESVKPQKQKNEKWLRVQDHANSDNSSDWRQAIIEADIMLEEVLRANGFPGDTIGDMLKSAKPGDFLTLNAAWDAHKVRNRIAHDGGDFQLSEREVRRVIALFEEVFKEFGVI